MSEGSKSKQQSHEAQEESQGFMVFREEYCEKQEKSGLSNKEKTLLAHP